MSELDELLARAVELDLKAAEAGDDEVAELAAEVDELSADAGGLDVNEPGPDDLEPAGDEGGDEWGGGEVDVDEGVDFDEPDDAPLERAEDLGRMVTDEEKAAGWGACPSCGSTERDEFDDDTARCSECGTILSPAVSKKGFDFDDLEPDDAPEVEVKSGLDTMDEMDLLRRERLDLEA